MAKPPNKSKKPARRSKPLQIIPGTGRDSIFRNKKHGQRVQGIITAAGGRRFEEGRQALAKLTGRDPEQISDADTTEFLARGPAETKLYLNGEVE